MARLKASEPTSIKASKRAAVAAFIRGSGSDSEVLLMRRSVSKADRWSGQVCLPGGMAEETDRDSAATAERETLEELGVDLQRCGQYMGRLDDVQAVARGRALTMVITPHVYRQTVAPQIALNNEAARAFWLPLSPAADGEFDASYQYGSGASTVQLPSWRYDNEVVWGLTYKILRLLLVLVDDGA